MVVAVNPNQNQYMQHIHILLLLAALYISFAIGQRIPNEKTKRNLGLSLIKSHISKWHSGVEWECVRILTDFPGPFGFPIRVVVLKYKDEQILISSCPSMPIGTKVKLRPRRPDEKATISIGVVDEFMIPIY